MKLLAEVDVFGKKVFVRADLDVQSPDANDQVGKATRLTNLKPTVDYLLAKKARQIIIGGHLDRPKGPDPAISTKKLVRPLETILGQSIAFNPNLTLEDVSLTKKLVLLENLRFWLGEKGNSFDFAKKLASLADIYINEAFGNCHRNHASMVVLPQLLPHAAGLHLAEEVEVLSNLLRNPARQFVAIVGGAKIETKLPVIENLAKFADFVLVGGAIAKQLTTNNLQLTNKKSDVSGQVSNVIVANLTEDTKDINLESIDRFRKLISIASTVVWNGPMGLFEQGFDKGSLAIAREIIDSGTYSVVGGGETTRFLASKKILSSFSFVSSGGGAMLEFLSGKKLPGIEALS